jgi:hypothetical protein
MPQIQAIKMPSLGNGICIQASQAFCLCVSVRKSNKRFVHSFIHSFVYVLIHNSCKAEHFARRQFIRLMRILLGEFQKFMCISILIFA